MYFGSDLGSTAFSKFRITADTSSGSYSGKMYLEGYLDNVANPHYFTFANYTDYNASITFLDTLTDSTHQYVYAEIDIDGGGLCLSHPLDKKHGGSGTTSGAVAIDGTSIMTSSLKVSNSGTSSSQVIEYKGASHFRNTNADGNIYTELYLTNQSENAYIHRVELNDAGEEDDNVK